MTESKRTTLTREQLLGKIGKPRYKEVEIDGIGVVGIRQRTRLQESRRTYAMFDSRGKVIQEKACLQPIYRIIDQVMVDESTPMFTDDDVYKLAEGPEGDWVEQLMEAVQDFNMEVDDDPKKSDESSGSSES